MASPCYLPNYVDVEDLRNTIPDFDHVRETLHILQRGLNDPVNDTALYVWRDISEMVLTEEVTRLERSMTALLGFINTHSQKETF